MSYPSRSVRTRLKTSSGAGVNADVRTDTTLVECRTDNKASCPWDAEPSNMVLSPTRSMRSRGTSDDTSISDRNVTKVQSELTLSSEADLLIGTNRVHHSGRIISPLYISNDMAEGNPVEEECVVHSDKNKECNYEEQALSCGYNVQFEERTRSKIDAGQQSENSLDALQHLANKTKLIGSLGRIKDLAGTIKDVASGNQTLGLKEHGWEDAPIKGLESSAEYDVQDAIKNNACGLSEKGSLVESSYAVDVFKTSKDDKLNLLQDKGKELTFFGKDIFENLSVTGDNSHDSMGSSNSATLSSKGKKRGNCEHQLVVGSKRIKSLPQEASTSSSPIKPDSSFLNWISNMVKGSAKANQDEGPLGSYNKQVQACDQSNKIQDASSGHMGFQSIFRSLYCPKTIVTERSHKDYPTLSGAKKYMEGEKSLINVMPISFRRGNDESCKELLMDNNDYHHHTLEGNGGDLSSQPRVHCANNYLTSETWKSKLIEIENLSRLACNNREDRVISSGTSQDGQEKLSFEDKSSHILSECQAMPNICNKSDPSQSLWITRFSSRTPNPALDLHHYGSKKVVSEDSAEYVPQNHVNSSYNINSEAAESYAEKPVNVVGNDKFNCATSLKVSIGLNMVVGHNHGNPLCRVKSPPPTLKSLEPMASAFARRLEVLKSIPSVTQDDPTYFRSTCLYCGKSGHNVVSCSDVQKSELVDLMRNISSYDGAKGSSNWCIKCHQEGHLAITCPVASSSRQQQLYKNASMQSCRTAGTLQLYKNSEPYSDMLYTNMSHCKVPVRHIGSSGNVSKILGSDNNPSCYGELEVKEKPVPPLSKSASMPLPDDAIYIFEAVRKLRLSRMDILKCMNLHLSLVHLNGFFLRLRLRKCETELGGTGYYVACINELQRETSKDAEKSIFVNVGDFRCSVESQYISNHEFSEDELMAWWHTISKTDDIPTLDDLRLKFEEKQKLGL